MESSKFRGMAVAVSAAALFMTGCAATSGGTGATEARISCAGGNACKGQSECHTANNACSGQNACKGQGVVSLTPEECKKATGRS